MTYLYFIGKLKCNPTVTFPELKYFAFGLRHPTCFPKFLNKSSKLIYLNAVIKKCRNEDVKELPKSIKCLNLTVYKNHKKSIPAELFQLPNLEVLVYDGWNRIWKNLLMPKNMQPNKSIVEAYLPIDLGKSQNVDGILKLQNLKHLSVNSLSLKDQDVLEKLSHLESIYVLDLSNKNVQLLKKKYPNLTK